MYNDEIDDLKRMYNINKKLLNTLHKIGFDLIHFAKKYDYPIPKNISSLLGESQQLINELTQPTGNSKTCYVCNNLSPQR